MQIALIDKDKAEVKEMIQSLYAFVHIPLDLEDVTENVAKVFGTMLDETRKCSNAFGWISKSPGGRPSITWLAMQSGNGLFNLIGIDLTGFLGPPQSGVAPVNKPFDCFLPNASGVSYCKLECGRTVL